MAFNIGSPQIHKRSLVCGVGINDFNGTTSIGGIRLYEYRLWKDLLKRCYSEKYQIKQPTYKGCEVEDYLLSFTNFYNFIKEVKGFGCVDGNGRRYQLDKDVIFSGNKKYNRETICFVPHEINSFLTKPTRVESKYKLGVCYHKQSSSYAAKISIGGVVKTLGYYKAENEAFQAYVNAKEHYAKILAEKYKDNVDHRVYDSLMNYKVL